MSAIAVIAFVVGFSVWNMWRERGLHKEFDRNDKHEPPDTHQLKWDVRHLREDISLLCHLTFAAVALLAVIAFK